MLEIARQTPELADRAAIYGAFADSAQDAPALVLFFPRFLYVVPNRLQGVDLGLLSTTSQRFDDVQRWSLEAAAR